MRVARWLFAAFAVLAAPSVAQGLDPQALPELVHCLTPPLDRLPPLPYPAEELERRDGGTVEVVLEFFAPDAPPRLKWMNTDYMFANLFMAVSRHVRPLRMPCLKPGAAPIWLHQEYVFTPNDGRKVMATLPVEVSAPGTMQEQPPLPAQISCRQHVDGDDRPSYPRKARREESEGSVVAVLNFTAADQPPQVAIFDSTGSQALRGAVSHFVSGLRMPCLRAGATVREVIPFNFKLEGGSRTLLRDLTLLHLLQSAQDLPLPAFFDFDRMGCPFDVRLRYMQPHRRNGVRELDSTHPARRPFLDWLSKIKLGLSEKKNTAVVGDEATISIPCGTLDL